MPKRQTREQDFLDQLAQPGRHLLYLLITLMGLSRGPSVYPAGQCQKVCVVSAPLIVPFFFCRAPRRPLLPTALGFRLTPHCPNAHLRPLPQQHVPTDFNAGKLFSLDSPLRPASVWSSRRRRLVPRPRFDAPPRRDRLLHALEGLAKLSPMAQAMGFGARVCCVRPRRADWTESRRSLALHTRPFRVVLGPVAMGTALPSGGMSTTRAPKHFHRSLSSSPSSSLTTWVSTRSPVELPTSTSTNPL
jgi:hypothetical protein